MTSVLNSADEVRFSVCQEGFFFSLRLSLFLASLYSSQEQMLLSKSMDKFKKF